MSAEIESFSPLCRKLAGIRAVIPVWDDAYDTISSAVARFCQAIRGASAGARHPLRWCPQNPKQSAILHDLDVVHEKLTRFPRNYTELWERGEEDPSMYCAMVKCLLVGHEIPTYLERYDELTNCWRREVT